MYAINNVNRLQSDHNNQYLQNTFLMIMMNAVRYVLYCAIAHQHISEEQPVPMKGQLDLQLNSEKLYNIDSFISSGRVLKIKKALK